MAKILVVDDEVSIRMGIREFAEYQGYEVEEAANGKEAVERCRQKDFDVIIMDIMMPEMDGYEAYKKIREIKDIPALMLSAKGEEYDKLQGFELERFDAGTGCRSGRNIQTILCKVGTGRNRSRY